jgi:hypothetical protein
MCDREPKDHPELADARGSDRPSEQRPSESRYRAKLQKFAVVPLLPILSAFLLWHFDDSGAGVRAGNSCPRMNARMSTGVDARARHNEGQSWTGCGARHVRARGRNSEDKCGRRQSTATARQQAVRRVFVRGKPPFRAPRIREARTTS